MIKMPQLVTEEGDINIHAQESATIPISFQLEDGTPRDMTGVTVNFIVEGGPTILLTTGSTTDQLMLEVEKGALNAGLGKARDFVVVEDGGGLHWSGRLNVWGFA